MEHVPSQNKDMEVTRVSIVGHSFIRHFRDAIESKGHTSCKTNLGINNVRVQLVCKGGWWVVDVLRACQEPRIFIMQRGSNDLCLKVQPIAIEAKLCDTAKKILMDTNADLVLVCQILHLSKGRFLKTQFELQTFNSKVDEVNRFLKENCASNEGIKFWRHRGMKKPDLDKTWSILCADGIHLSSRGQYKSYKSTWCSSVWNERHSLKQTKDNCELK